MNEVDLKRNRRMGISFPTELQAVINTYRPISTLEYNNLQELLQWVPKEFHKYYQELSHELSVDEYFGSNED
ncbi:hypothetical protein ILUMI_16033, partial [Ignelater luminosus]